MRKILLLAAGVSGLVSGTVYSAEPTLDLQPKEAVRLIAMKDDIQPNTIEISFILDGTAGCGPGFEAKHVRRVASVQPVRDGSSSVRKVVFHNLYWNESLGWFMWQTNQERAGEVVYLWSELKGEIVNR